MLRGGLGATIRARAALAVGAALASAGCSRVLDFSAPVGDAAPVDADTTDATDTCTLDEPNGDLATATPAASGTRGSSICPAADRDFYGFTLDGATDLVAVLRFDGAAGAEDLELTLHDATAMTAVTISTGLDDDERIEHSAALGNPLPAGSYALEVLGRDDAVKNSYVLELTIGPPP